MRYMTFGSIAALTAALVLFVSAHSFAETRVADAATGSISGKVTDAEGNAVGGASVKVMPKMNHEKQKLDDAENKKVRPAALKETVTDAEGHYKIEGLPAGECVVMAMSKDKGRGYATVTVVAEKHTDGVHIKLAQPAK